MYYMEVRNMATTIVTKQLKAYVDGLLWVPDDETIDVVGLSRFGDSVVCHNDSEKAKVLLLTTWKDCQELIDMSDSNNIALYRYNKTENKWLLQISGGGGSSTPTELTLEEFLGTKTKQTLTDTITYEATGDSTISLANLLTSGKSYLFELTFNGADTTLTRIDYRFYDESNNTLQTTSCRDMAIPYYDVFEADEIYPKIVCTSNGAGVLDYTINIYEL